jgi:hypothetical protein
LYRSEKTDFNVDSGNKVDSLNIGSDKEGTFTNSVPDCQKSYYYAIRSFDQAGNGSGVIGDSVINKVTTVITKAPAVIQPTAAALPVENVILPSPINEGNIMGVMTTPSSPTAISESTSEEGEVQGAATNIYEKKIYLISIIISLGFALIFMAGIMYYVQRKKEISRYSFR